MMNRGAKDELRALKRKSTGGSGTQREAALSVAPCKSQLSRLKSEFKDKQGRIWYNARTTTISEAWSTKVAVRMENEPTGQLAYWVKLTPNSKAADAPQVDDIIDSDDALASYRLVVLQLESNRGRAGAGTCFVICDRPRTSKTITESKEEKKTIKT